MFKMDLLVYGLLCLKIFSLNSVSSEEDFPEPVLFLPLNKEYGIRDVSKNYLQPTAAQVSLAPGPDGKPDGAYYFQGSSSSYIEIPQHSQTDVRYSLSFFTWVYNEGRYGPLMHYDTGGVPWGVHIFIHLNGSPSSFYVALITRGNVNDGSIVPIEHPMATNKWQYLGFTFDYSTGKATMYMDGIVVKQAVMPKFDLNTNYKIKIGGTRYSHSDDKAFKGRLSCFQLYNKPLTQKQAHATRYYCQRNAPYMPCVHYESIDDWTRLLNGKTTNQPSDKKTLSRVHWYRFTNAKISLTCPTTGLCGAQIPGWINGTYPTRGDGIQTLELCYRSVVSNCCGIKFKVLARQCYGFYVYKFDNFPDNGRFCTEKDPNIVNDVMFMSTYERCLTGHVFYNATDVTEISKCIAYCISAGDNCKSVNFIIGENGMCQLNNAAKEQGTLRVDTKCTYYQKV